jgi:hypothetical protein
MLDMDYKYNYILSLFLLKINLFVIQSFHLIPILSFFPVHRRSQVRGNSRQPNVFYSSPLGPVTGDWTGTRGRVSKRRAPLVSDSYYYLLFITVYFYT